MTRKRNESPVRTDDSSTCASSRTRRQRTKYSYLEYDEIDLEIKKIEEVERTYAYNNDEDEMLDEEVKQQENGVYGPSDDPSLIDKIVASDKKQVVCCLLDCERNVTNRLRFSLRLNHWFKRDCLEKRWDKVCEYHYFNDRYLHKKQGEDTIAEKKPKKRQVEPTLKKNKTRKKPKRETKKRRISETIKLQDEIVQRQIETREEDEEDLIIQEEEEFYEQDTYDFDPDSSIDEVAFSTPTENSPNSPPQTVIFIQESEIELHVTEEIFFDTQVEMSQNQELITNSNVVLSPISSLENCPFDKAHEGIEKCHQLQMTVERLTWKPVSAHHMQWDFSQRFVPSHEFA
jgi:hypothetical protein